MGGHINWSIESPEREVRVGQNWPEQTWMECIAFQSSIPDSAERVWSPWSLPTLPFQSLESWQNRSSEGQGFLCQFTDEKREAQSWRPGLSDRTEGSRGAKIQILPLPSRPMGRVSTVSLGRRWGVRGFLVNRGRKMPPNSIRDQD